MNHGDEMPERRSSAAKWAPLAHFIAADEQIARWAGKGRTTAFLYEFVRFGVKQGWACPIRRCDGGAFGRHFAVVSAQCAARPLRFSFPFRALETFEEAKVILIFHLSVR